MPDLTEGYPRNKVIVDAIKNRAPLTCRSEPELIKELFINNFMPYAKSRWEYHGTNRNCEDLSSALWATQFNDLARLLSAAGELHMTHASIVVAFIRLAAGALAVLVSPMVDPAAAQDRPGPAAEFAAGWVGFADDGVVNESLVGGAARWYLLPRISVGPEVVYINGDNHSHLVVTGNLTFDVLGPIDRRPRPVTPFLVAGGGVFQTRESFPRGSFTSSDGAFTAGGGVRAVVADRVTVGIDARIGWELHLRVNGTIGLRLGP